VGGVLLQVLMTIQSPICARCRQPIAGPLRKDRFGNAYCEPCAQALIAATERVRQRTAGLQSIRASAAAAAGVAAPAIAAPAAAPPEPVGPPPGPPPIPLVTSPPPNAAPTPKLQERGPLIERPDPFAPEPPLSPDGTIALEPPTTVAKPRMRACESCSKLINAEVKVCPYCSYDQTLGPPGKLKKPLHTCRHCGYDLAGLPEPICPECGHRNARRSTYSSLYDDDSREITRWAYLRPVIMLGVGLFGICLFALLRYHDPKYVAFTLIRYAVEVPVVLGVYIGCCAAWIGFDMPLRLVALRLAGIFAVVDLIADVVGIFPIWVVWLSVSGIAYIWMLAQELDLDLQDALIIAIISGGATAIAWMVVLGPIATAMGLSL
jgi:RNA polymerase subunit RPABC4/transcription elongation factor Spt4